MKFLLKLLTNTPKYSDLLLKAMFVIAFIIIPSFFHTKTAEAAFFSFMADMMGGRVSASTVDDSNSINSQNIALLHAVINSDPNPNKSNTDGPIALGNALVAEIGPAGTASEVEDESSNQISLYTVKSGDNLSKIAKMFSVSVNTIIWANGLGKNPTIKEGDTLVILPISGIKYAVKKGDTIKGIVLRYKADLDEVLQYNNLTLASTLTIGDTIVIPDAEPTVIDTPKIAAGKSGGSSRNTRSLPYYPGYYIRPIDVGIKSQGLHGNNAVDLAASVGIPIHAAAEGIVIASMINGGWNGGYGNYVIISHANGTQTLYAHTQKNFVKVGDNVEQGQMIAKVGMTGKTTGPHVHFEIRGAKNPF